MIDLALKFVNKVLNQQLRNQFNLDTDPVVNNNIVDSNGGTPLSNQNKIVLTLINLENETNKAFYGGNKTPQHNQVQQIQPAARFNLDILISANFDVYDEALKFLSAVIAFFQSFPTLNKQLFPDMPQSMTQLQFEVENSPYSQTHNLWSALGAKYQPSVIYKVRHITVQADQLIGDVAAVQKVSGEAYP